VPERRFTHVHVDIVGPLPTSAEGFSYLFTMVDWSTRWLEAVTIKSITAQQCLDTFIAAWVARYGVPATITSDQGRQFTSALWAGLHKLLGVQLINTTAYHSQSNGMVERCLGQLKAALRALLASREWPEHLPWVLLGLRTAPKEDSAISSAELMFGTPLSLPAEFIRDADPPAEHFLERLRGMEMPATRPLTYAEVATKSPTALMEASYVYIRRGGAIPPLASLYADPYKVVARQAKFFKLEIGGRLETVSVDTDRLKPHLGLDPVVSAAPPVHGRSSDWVTDFDSSA
jgi:hypothetical protein